MTEIRYDEALGALAEAFGDRLGRIHPREEAFVSPASVEEARLLAEIAARYSVPLVPLGAEVLTQVEQVQAIGEAIGQPLRFEELSRETARQGMIAAWGDPSTVDGMLDAGAAFVMQPERVTSTVEEVTGAPAHTFRQWVTDHADDFR